MDYDPTLATDLDKIRFHIGDTVQDDGPRPDRRNFSDEEIEAVLEEWGSYPCAVSAMFEILAAEWAARPISGPGELGIVHDNATKQYLSMANLWRQRCPSTDAAPGALDIPAVGVQVVNFARDARV